MIAVDTSSLVAFLDGAEGADVESVDRALELQLAALPPVVLTEILSAPRIRPRLASLLRSVPLLEVQPGFWTRAAESRRAVLRRGLRARLADTLIAQACIDAGAPLITRDRDFRHFEKHCGLVLT